MNARRSGLVFVVVAACGGSAPPPSSTATPPPAHAGRSRGQDAYDEGYKLASSGDLEGGLAQFRKATELDPQLAIAWFDVGGLSEQLGDIPGAMSALARSVAANPAFAEARVELGTLYRQVGKLDPAVAQFRSALTTAAPYIDQRFTLKYTRGHALHNLAATYVDLKFPAAAAAIAASLLNDDNAQDDDLDRLIDRTEQMLAPGTPSPALVPQFTSFERDLDGASSPAAAGTVADTYQAFVRTVDVDTAAPIDRWRALRTMAKAQARARRFAQADALLVRANDLAHTLSLIAWLDGTYDQIAVHVQANQLDAALAELDQLLWIEMVTQYARGEIGGRKYSMRAKTDHALEALRASPKLSAMFEMYRAGAR